MAEPTLDQIITFLDEKYRPPLLQENKEYIEKALNGENVYIPSRDNLRLSRFLVDLGVIVAYLSAKKVIMWTHAAYWAIQAEQMQKTTIHYLNEHFGIRDVDMEVIVPYIGEDTFDEYPNALLLAHGPKPSSDETHQFVHQDLGSSWDGMIRPTMGGYYSNY